MDGWHSSANERALKEKTKKGGSEPLSSSSSSSFFSLSLSLCVLFLPRRNDNWLCSCLSWPYLVKSPPNSSSSNWRRSQWLAASVKRADRPTDRHVCISVLTSSAHRSAPTTTHPETTYFITRRLLQKALYIFIILGSLRALSNEYLCFLLWKQKVKGILSFSSKASINQSIVLWNEASEPHDDDNTTTTKSWRSFYFLHFKGGTGI